jgi:hypothetical protein
MAGSVMVIETTASALAAYAFARLEFKGRDLLFLLYLSTFIVPRQVTVIPLFILMRNFNWIDTYQGLIIPQAFSAFGTFLLRQFFLTIPRERISFQMFLANYRAIVGHCIGDAGSVYFPFPVEQLTLAIDHVQQRCDCTHCGRLAQLPGTICHRLEPAHGRGHTGNNSSNSVVFVHAALVR